MRVTVHHEPGTVGPAQCGGANGQQAGAAVPRAALPARVRAAFGEPSGEIRVQQCERRVRPRVTQYAP